MQSHKICPTCKENKPASEYTTRKGERGRMYLQSRCKPCASAAADKHQKEKYPNKEDYNKSVVAYRRTPSGALSWFRTKAKRLGLSYDEVEKAAAVFLANEGHCEVCGDDPIARGNKYGLCLDHCHDTLTFRGLLCTQCNSMLGHAKDRTEVLRAGAEYLENHRVSVSVEP